MERKIKFRGKNIHTGEWLYGDYHREGKTHYITKPGDYLREYAPIEFIVDGKTVGQFTGLLDKNGKEIYEGDVLRSPLGNVVIVKFGYKEHVVKHDIFTDSFAAYGWIVENVKNGITDFLDNEFLQGEVIGNIHDTPLPNKRQAMKQVTAYRCDHCGKMFMRDYNCRKHESQCTKNPLIRPLCYDCKFYQSNDDSEEEVKIWVDSYFGEQCYTKQFHPHRCTHPDKNCKLFANIHMNEDTYIALTDDGWEAMPTPKDGGCEYFEQSEYGKKREI